MEVNSRQVSILPFIKTSSIAEDLGGKEIIWEEHEETKMNRFERVSSQLWEVQGYMYDYRMWNGSRVPL